jgi:hypothetical protein
MEILKSMKDTDYETLMNDIVKEIETKEIKKVEESKINDIRLAIFNFFNNIKETYILKKFLNMDDNLKTFSKHINSKINNAMKIQENINKLKKTEDTKQNIMKRIFENQKNKEEINYRQNKKKIYQSVILFLSNIMNDKIIIKYNNDKTKVADETIHELDKIIESSIDFESLIKEEEEEENKKIMSQTPTPKSQTPKSKSPTPKSKSPTPKSPTPKSKSQTPKSKSPTPKYAIANSGNQKFKLAEYYTSSKRNRTLTQIPLLSPLNGKRNHTRKKKPFYNFP